MTPLKRFLLRGARLIDPHLNLDRVADLWIDAGQILAIGTGPAVTPDTRVVNLEGSWIFPALTDLHVRLGEPDVAHPVETLARAAVAGGYTRLVSAPDTRPVNDVPAVTRHLTAQFVQQGLVTLHPLGAATLGLEGQQLAEMGGLTQAGVVGFSDGGQPIARSDVLRHVLEYLRPFDRPLFLRCEDGELAAGGVVHEGSMATRLGLKGIPSVAEEVAIYRALALARHTGTRVHLCQLSTARAVDLVREAKETGQNVTCDASPHHLWFTGEVVRGYGTSARVLPPLRETSDRQALIHGVNDGTIDVISSGHTPQRREDKDVEFEAALPGVSSLETTLSAVVTLVRQGALNLERALKALTYRPASVVGLPYSGIAEGAPADLTVVAPDELWKVDPERLQSACRSSLFAGHVLNGPVKLTFRAGLLVFEAAATTS